MLSGDPSDDEKKQQPAKLHKRCAEHEDEDEPSHDSEDSSSGEAPAPKRRTTDESIFADFGEPAQPSGKTAWSMFQEDSDSDEGPVRPESRQ
jgi:hypothetical protein